MRPVLQASLGSHDFVFQKNLHVFFFQSACLLLQGDKIL